jgi:hypothetical protein
VSDSANEQLRAVGARFEIGGAFRGAERLGRGHIHDTYVACYDGTRGEARYVHQRLNRRVFPDLGAVMRNVERVTSHLHEKWIQRGVRDPERRALRLLPTREGASHLEDPELGVWRTFLHVADSRSADVIEDPAQARGAARAFGEFAAMLADLPGPPLEVVIPGFHDLRGRFQTLLEAIEADPQGRAGGARLEIDAACRWNETVQRGLDDVGAASLPRRTVHNDCKLNNLLLDVRSGEPLAVIDLDTVMPDTLLCDFGELVRTAACPVAEDERDLERIEFDPEILRALADGYLAGAGALIGREERLALPWAGPWLTLENGIRFLADHLSGDGYFRVERPGQNLDRARAQLRRLERMMARLDLSRQIFEGG